ncbi:EamA family transporter [Rhodococcus sp. 3Y1]
MKNWKAIGSSRFAVVGALLLVGMLWGSSFPLVAVAAPTLGAVGTTHGRFIVAALVLALITASSRSTWRAVGHRFPAFLLLAALNVAGPLTLVATAIVGLNSSTASILNATTPMFTVFVAAFWLRQKITWRKLSGSRSASSASRCLSAEFRQRSTVAQCWPLAHL